MALLHRSRLLRRLAIASAALLVLLVLAAFFFPWLLKCYIEAHSEEWIARRIHIDRIVLNPFTFNYGVYGFTCHEPQSDSVFVSWEELSVKAHVIASMMDDDWRFRDLVFEKPYFRIVQQGDRFNFSDLLELGGATDTTTAADTSAATVRFSMEHIRIGNGRIDYSSDVLHQPVSVLDLHVACDRITLADEPIHVDLGFGLNTGGRLAGGFMIDPAVQRYGIDARVNDFDLRAMEPYLQEFFDGSALKGALDIELRLVDSWVDTTTLAVSGNLLLKDFELLDPQGQLLQRLARGTVVLDTLTAEGQRFDLGSVELDGSHTRFVMRADSTDNWTSLIHYADEADSSAQTIEASESNAFVMLADYLSLLGEGLVMNEFSARHMKVSNSQVDFEDHMPAQPFRFSITGIELSSTRGGEGGIAPLTAHAHLGQSGHLVASAVFDPNDIRNVEVEMRLDSLSMHELNAYGMWYGAHPLVDGMASYTTTTSIKGGIIRSQNHIRVTNLQVARKLDGGYAEGIYVLPLRLAVALLKDRHGNIELNVPVEGDLNDPKFKVWPIVWQVLKNLVTKVIAAPVTAIASLFDQADPEDLEQVRYAALQVQVDKPQRKAARTLAQVLRERPGLGVDLVPITDTVAEQGRLAVWLLKQQWLFGAASLTAADSVRLAAVADRDSSFLAYLDQQRPGMQALGAEDRCRALVGAERLATQWRAVEQERRTRFQAQVVAEGVPAESLRFRAAQGDESRGRIGPPGYRFLYREAP